MRFSPRTWLFLAPLPILSFGVSRWMAPAAVAQNPIYQLPAPPILGGPVIGRTPLARKTPLSVATPVPFVAPLQNAIRVGISTKGGPLGIYLPNGAILTDGAQAGRRMQLPPNSRLQFSIGPVFTVQNGAQKWRGPISFDANGLSQGWQIVKIQVLGSQPARALSDGANPRWGRPFRGHFEVFPQRAAEPFKRKGPLALVNVVGLEDYLKGVVPWEMSPSAPLEALKAQAICARTKTLNFVRSAKFKSGGFDVCDYDACQGYPGTENEKPATTRAVEETRNLALFSGGAPIDAVYSTNSGGVTAAARDVWKASSPVSYLESVADFREDSSLGQLWGEGMSEAKWAQFCAQAWPSFARPDQAARAALQTRRARFPVTAALYGPQDWPEFYRWKREISVLDAQKALQNQGLARISGFSIEQRAPSGRIRRLKVWGFAPTPISAPQTEFSPAPTPLSGAPKTLIVEGDGKIRSLFSGRLGSTTALPSSLFTVTPQTDAQGKIRGWLFQGAGWGHGVGMCQRGAQNHAIEGWNARQITAFYYRGVELKKVG